MPVSPIYLAGYFDGEGSVMMKRQSLGTSYLSRVAMSSAFLPMLEVFRQEFGGTIRAKRTYARKPLWQWDMTRHSQVLYFLRVIEPHSVEKLPQIRLLIRWMEHQPPCLRRFRNGRDRTYDLEGAERCFLALRALKQPNPDLSIADITFCSKESS